MSIEIRIDLAGAEEFKQAVMRFDAETQKQLSERLAEWAETVKTEAARIVPVRTGYLRSTIYARTAGWQAEIGAEAAYAANVEFGTFHARAQPFIHPAVQAHVPELEHAFLEALDVARAEAGL